MLYMYAYVLRVCTSVLFIAEVLYSLDQTARLLLFQYTILCGFYLRAATIKEWHFENL